MLLGHSLTAAPWPSITSSLIPALLQKFTHILKRFRSLEFVVCLAAWPGGGPMLLFLLRASVLNDQKWLIFSGFQQLQITKSARVLITRHP